jgi:hypothetical protein
MNLVRYVYNTSISQVDLLGEKVYAVDGTWSTGMPNTNVKTFYRDIISGHTGGFFEGPQDGPLGSDANVIANGLYSLVCKDIKAYFNSVLTCGKTMRIDFIGWSRGGVIVVQTAALLRTSGCQVKTTVRIHPAVSWIGLFDAVNMTGFPAWESTTIPPNVSSASHAIKTTLLEPYYPTKRYTGVTEKLFYKSDGSVTTHGEIGKGWSSSSVWDNSVINWMKEQAIAKSVPVKP